MIYLWFRVIIASAHWDPDNLAVIVQTFLYWFIVLKCCILIKIALEGIPKLPVYKKPSLVQIMTGAEQATRHYQYRLWPSLLTHIWATHLIDFNSLIFKFHKFRVTSFEFLKLIYAGFPRFHRQFQLWLVIYGNWCYHTYDGYTYFFELSTL